MSKPSLGSSQAFPVPWPDGPPAPGMTLREYYAGLAMQGLLASWPDDGGGDLEPNRTGKVACAFADALLAALEAKSNG